VREIGCFASRFVLLATACAAVTMCAADDATGDSAMTTLIDHGKVRYEVIVAADAAPATQHAANELDQFLRQIGKAEDSPTPDDPSVSIFLGPSDLLADAMPGLDASELGFHDYIIRTSGDNLAIVGGSPRGILNGVYGLLERFFDCRWFMADVSRIPQRSVVAVPHIDLREGPAFPRLRWAFCKEMMGNRRDHGYEMNADDAAAMEWASRNRANTVLLGEKRGGPGPWKHLSGAHTFHRQVPPDKYFADHPEYYSLIGGKRSRNAQLCLSDPEVLNIIVQSIFEAKAANPERMVFTVCPMDWHGYCECAECRKLDQANGGPSGTVHWFVNRVAEKVSAQYPDVYILGLAYAYYLEPPRHERMHPNVIIQIATSPQLHGGCGVHAFETCEKMQNVAKLVKAWGKKCDNLALWYYAVNFWDYFMPFPNLYALGDNLRFFRDHQVTAAFIQMNYRTKSCADADLRSYLAAKLLWNPDQDVDVLIDEFLEGVYGAAAPPLEKYLKLMQAMVDAPGVHMQCYTILNLDNPDWGCRLFTPKIVNEADALFDEAERLAATPEIRERVKYMRLPVTYLKIKSSRGQLLSGPPMKVSPEVVAEARRLIEDHGIKYWREGQKPIKDIYNLLDVDGTPLLEWWELGPMPAPAEEEKERPHNYPPPVKELFKIPPPESDLDKTFTGSDGKPVRWTKRPPEKLYLDFRDRKGQRNKDIMYGLARVWAPEDMSCKMAIGTADSGVQLFVNGTSVFTWAWHRPGPPVDDWQIQVELKKGMNEVLVMLRRDTHNWQAMIRFNDPEGVLRNDY